MEKGPDLEKIIEEIEPDTEAGSKPLEGDEFKPTVISNEEDMTKLERESEAAVAPAEVTPNGEEVGEAIEQAAREVSETAEALESELSKIEEEPKKPAPEEGSWE